MPDRIEEELAPLYERYDYDRRIESAFLRPFSSKWKPESGDRVFVMHRFHTARYVPGIVLRKNPVKKSSYDVLLVRPHRINSFKNHSGVIVRHFQLFRLRKAPQTQSNEILLKLALDRLYGLDIGCSENLKRVSERLPER